MGTEVFIYSWTYWDGETDSHKTNHSTFKVTREFVEQRKQDYPAVTYEIIETTGEFVESCAVVDGRFHPHLRTSFFQRQVK